MNDDRFYFYRRAEEALERAQASEDPIVVDVQYRLAETYLGLAYGGADAAEHDPATELPVSG